MVFGYFAIQQVVFEPIENFENFIFAISIYFLNQASVENVITIRIFDEFFHKHMYVPESFNRLRKGTERRFEPLHQQTFHKIE